MALEFQEPLVQIPMKITKSTVLDIQKDIDKEEHFDNYQKLVGEYDYFTIPVRTYKPVCPPYTEIQFTMSPHARYILFSSISK